VLAELTFAMSEKDPTLRVSKAVAYYYSLHRNLRLDFINDKPRRCRASSVGRGRPATFKTLIESKQEMCSAARINVVLRIVMSTITVV
jgi:hypothetical protein